MAITVKFTVRGAGQFPLDMLRYDCCHPHGSDDVRQMEHDRSIREVTLVRVCMSSTAWARQYAVTEGRWASFGWTVIDQVLA